MATDDASQDPIIILIGSRGFLGGQLYSDLVCQGYLPMRAESNLIYLEEMCSRSKFGDKTVILISMSWSSNRRRDYLNNPENSIWAARHIEIAKFCLRNDFFFVVPGTCLEYLEDRTVEYIKSKIQLKKFLEENMPLDKFLWLRYFYVFSIVHRRPGLVRDALDAKGESRPLLVGNIDRRHDYIEVRDAVAQTIDLVKGHHDGVWDIGAGRTRSNRELISRIGNVDFLESMDAEHSKKPRIGWEDSAKKLIPNHTQLIAHTNTFFGNLLP